MENTKLIFKHLKERMKSLGVRQYQLAKHLEVSEPTLIRYFKLETPMPLYVYIEICDFLAMESSNDKIEQIKEILK